MHGLKNMSVGCFDQVEGFGVCFYCGTVIFL